jgi:hypothetical protein
VASTCTANENGVTASSTITNGWFYADNGWADSDTVYPEPPEPPGPSGGIQLPEHDPVKVLVPTNPAPNSAFPGHLHIARNHQDDYVIVFNEQIWNPDGSLTVNGAHYYFGYTLQDGRLVPNESAILKGDMVVARSVCGVALDGTTPTTGPTTTTTVAPTGGATAVSPRSMETGQPFTSSANGVSAPSTPYVLKISTQAATCPTGVLIGGSVVASPTGVIPHTQRLMPLTITSGQRWICWVSTDDTADFTSPVAVTIF